jgi:hypothetical protein
VMERVGRRMLLETTSRSYLCRLSCHVTSFIRLIVLFEMIPLQIEEVLNALISDSLKSLRTGYQNHDVLYVNYWSRQRRKNSPCYNFIAMRWRDKPRVVG